MRTRIGFLLGRLCLLFLILNSACDDPVPGPIGGLILVIRSFEATKDPDIRAIANIEIQTQRIEAMHSNMLGGGEESVVVDTQSRTIIIANDGTTDRLVGQYQAPPGYISQIRIFPAAVTLHLKDATSISFEVPSSNIPSWGQSGWKIEPVDGNPWPIKQDELTGVRALFEFDDKMLHNKGNGYKLKPTVSAEQFEVNPPNDDPGVFADQVTVVFAPGTTRAQIDAINAEIGASVLVPPILSDAYRIKLPVSKTVEDAFNFYGSRSEVEAVIPAVNYSPFQLVPNEDQPGMLGANLTIHRTVDLPLAWADMAARNVNVIGSYKVRVAVLDTGIETEHRDLYENIAINFREIPANVRERLLQYDLDSTISFVDLNVDANRDLVPPDWNRNGYIDAVDLVAPGSPWVNNVDDDGNGLIDDLVGWNFGDDNNRPADYLGHGTGVAGVLGAVGNNRLRNGVVGQDIAGTIWTVSIVPIRIPRGTSGSIMDVRAIDGLEYARRLGVDIVNGSFGWNFLSENAGQPSCLAKGVQITKNLPEFWFNRGVDNYERAYSRVISPQTLYVFAAGNTQVNLADPNARVFPAQAAKAVMRNKVLIVGDSGVSASGIAPITNSITSNYGEGVVDIWAPGSGWNSLAKFNGMQNFNGTSAAAPVVSGIAALSLAFRPTDTQTLHDSLLLTAVRRIQISVCQSPNFLPGLQLGINAYYALQ